MGKYEVRVCIESPIRKAGDSVDQSVTLSECPTYGEAAQLALDLFHEVCDYSWSVFTEDGDEVHWKELP